MKTLTDLILENEGLIYKIIVKYKNYFELDDLYQVAVMGMIRAYKNYQGSFNTKFTSYAYPYIVGEVIKYINEYRNIKVNRKMKLLYGKILQAKDILTQRLMKEPSTYELSLFLELDEEVIDEVMQANMAVQSLDRIINEDDKNFELYSRLGYVDDKVLNYELSSEIDKLSPLERTIIFDRYYGDMSQKEVGRELGMYQVEVSRQERKILKKLKREIGE